MLMTRTHLLYKPENRVSFPLPSRNRSIPAVVVVENFSVWCMVCVCVCPRVRAFAVCVSSRRRSLLVKPWSHFTTFRAHKRKDVSLRECVLVDKKTTGSTAEACLWVILVRRPAGDPVAGPRSGEVGSGREVGSLKSGQHLKKKIPHPLKTTWMIYLRRYALVKREMQVSTLKPRTKLNGEDVSVAVLVPNNRGWNSQDDAGLWRRRKISSIKYFKEIYKECRKRVVCFW